VKIELNRDWTEFLSALIAHRVRLVLVGGHAVAGHGQPRLTEDLDVFVDPTPANGRRLRDALVAVGFGAVAPSAEERARKDRVFMLGRKPWRIDVRSRSIETGGSRGMSRSRRPRCAGGLGLPGHVVQPDFGH
jgi:hypothetical protein